MRLFPAGVLREGILGEDNLGERNGIQIMLILEFPSAAGLLQRAVYKFGT